MDFLVAPDIGPLMFAGLAAASFTTWALASALSAKADWSRGSRLESLNAFPGVAEKVAAKEEISAIHGVPNCGCSPSLALLIAACHGPIPEASSR